MSIEPNDVLLKADNLVKYFPVTQGVFKKTTGQLKAIDDVSFYIKKGETLGLVGESGCGKTTLGKCLVRLYEPTSGKLWLKGSQEALDDLLNLPKEDSFRTRRRIQLIFQDPYSALNPVKDVFSAFDEPMKKHNMGTRAQRMEKCAEIMEAVNLQADHLYRYPHEFSGGQRQRICIAKALAMDPELVVCDEPVSALDVSIQAQILNLMKVLQRKYSLTYLFIAHDLSVVQYMSDRVAVMYLGKIMEISNSRGMYENCVHPYTQALFSAVPVPKINAKRSRVILKGDVPSPIDPPSGCRFHTRCPRCTDICKKELPELSPLSAQADHLVACHHAGRA